MIRSVSFGNNNADTRPLAEKMKDDVKYKKQEAPIASQGLNEDKLEKSGSTGGKIFKCLALAAAVLGGLAGARKYIGVINKIDLKTASLATETTLLGKAQFCIAKAGEFVIENWNKGYKAVSEWIANLRTPSTPPTPPAA